MMFFSRSLLYHKSIICLLGLFATVAIPVSPAVAETWTDVTGTHTIEADFVGVWNDRVILQLTGGDGRRVAVEMTRLNAGSRLRAQELQRERVEWRARRMEEIRAAAKAAEEAKARAAALPPRPDIEYAPPPEDADLETFVAHWWTQQEAGNVALVTWDSLPASYRADLEAIVHTFGEKVDPQVWDAVLSLFGKVERLMTEKQEMIAALPMVETTASMKNLDPKVIVEPAAQLVAILFDPERLSKENLQQIKIGEALKELSDELAEPSYRLDAALSKLSEGSGASLEAAAMPEAASSEETGSEGAGSERAGSDGAGSEGANAEPAEEPQYKVEQQSADRGIVTITGPDGTIHTEPMVKVEGKWVPQSLADNWKEAMTQANETLAKLGTAEDPMKPAVQQLAPVSQFLDDLLAAETQTEFNGIVQALVSKAMPFIMQGMGSMQGMGPMQGGMAPMPPGGIQPAPGGPASPQ